MQQGLPTVGDTVTIVRHILAPVGAVIDARAPVDSSVATLVAPPVLTREGDSVRVAYTVAVWTAGHNDVVFPGAVIVDQRGHVDTLADAHVSIDVSSVLPARTPATIVPHPARPWLMRADVSALPFAVLLPLVVVVTDARIAAWLAAGESRLALEHLDAALRAGPEFADWRRRAAEVRFAQGNDAAIAQLVGEGARLAAGGSESRGDE
jgi:hypothetical protein